MLYEGQADAALRVIAAVRDRHDGRKRNPFDEPECGHHYARAMASWGCLLAYTGFRYDAIAQRLHFTASRAPATWFWSSGDAWGTFAQRPQPGDGTDVVLTVMGGALRVGEIVLEGVGSGRVASRLLNESDVLELRIRP